MIKLTMCYPSSAKENIGTEMLYSPLALAYLARHVPDHYKISLFDEYVGEDINPDTVDADLVALSPLTSGISRAYEISDKLRKRGITTVVGGAHASALPDEVLKHFDSVIIGEGELPWKQFLSDFENGNIQDTYFGAMNVSLDDVGTPCRDLTHKNYHYPSILTSRGCPYYCSFCYLTVYKKRKYRTIPNETVLEDMESLRNNPIIIITDENFIGYSEENMEDRKILLEKMIKRNFKFYWGCQSTVQLADNPELMSLMYKAGCRAVFIGFESMGEVCLREINKKHNIGTDYKEAIRKIHKQKLAVIASCILGMDNHKNNYHKTLIKDLRHIKADFVRVFYMTAWPGTPLFKKLEKEGRASTNWDNLRKDVPSIQFKHYSHDEVIRARKEIMDSFFNLFNIMKVLLRWVFIDRSLISIFIKMSVRNRISEKIRNSRAFLKIKIKPPPDNGTEEKKEVMFDSAR